MSKNNNFSRSFSFRKAKNYGEADRLRDEISDKGYYMEDTVDGYLIKKK